MFSSCDFSLFFFVSFWLVGTMLEKLHLNLVPWGCATVPRKRTRTRENFYTEIWVGTNIICPRV